MRVQGNRPSCDTSVVWMNTFGVGGHFTGEVVVISVGEGRTAWVTGIVGVNALSCVRGRDQCLLSTCSVSGLALGA